MGDTGTIGRLVSPSGAAFGLVPVPDPWGRPTGPAGRLLVDIELLTPDRLVCYLGRRIPTSSLVRLATAYLQAATDLHPEVTVPAVEIPEGGVSVRFAASGELDVTVECSVVEVLDADVPQHDVVTFVVPRARLVAVSHELSAWVDERLAPVGDVV